ncbi:MAG: DUF1285 domain-containing protein [Alphaproteobacteria bacterium]
MIGKRNIEAGAAAAQGGAAKAARPLLFCGDLDIRIAADGTWFHEGRPIRRAPLVKLFASVLTRDDGGDYWLVTPVERARIRVDDAPFLAVELKAEGEGESQRLSFRTNLDEWVTAGPSHPIACRAQPGGREPAPYLLVRDGLEAKLTRAVYYELAERAVEVMRAGRPCLGVHSEGAFFPLEPA